jgi:hypothetical protein
MTANPHTLSSLDGRFDPSWLHMHAAMIGCTADETTAACDALTSGAAVGLAASGKLASGKDTIAPAVLARLGVASTEHLFFARPLKTEFDMVLSVIRDSATDREAVGVLVDTLDMPQTGAVELVGIVGHSARADLALTAYHRTAEVRTGLQYLGTDVRRAQDPDWWVKRSLGEAVRALAAQRSVLYTDCRFPNEVGGARRIGCLTVRLDISAETQAQRLAARDGLRPDPEALRHPSETVLDDYERFDVRVSNDGDIEATVAEVAAALVEHRQALTSAKLAA